MTRPVDGDPPRREPSRATYQTLTDRLRAIDRNVVRDRIFTHTPEAKKVRDIVRNPSIGKLINHVNSFYRLENLDRVDEVARRESLSQTGSWSAEQMVQDFYFKALEAARKVDDIKYEVVRADFSPASNMLKTLILERYAWYVGVRYGRDLQSNQAFLEQMDIVGQQLFGDTDQTVQGYAPLSSIFLGGIRNAIDVMQNLSERRDTDTDAAELQRDNNALVERVEEFRRYGVKPAIVPGLTETVNEWLVTEPDSQIAELPDENSRAVQAFMPKNVARFVGVRGRFRSTRLEPHQMHGEEGMLAKMTYYSFADVLEPGSEIMYGVALSRNGDLLTQNGMPIKPFLEHTGEDLRGYEDLRSEILCHYSDLVTPAFVARELTEEAPPPPRTPITGPSTTEKSQRRQSLRRLILARVRYIGEHRERIADVLESGDNTEALAHPDIVQQVRRKHAIVPHLRDIGDKRAGPVARENALKKFGLELPERGITFVNPKPIEEDESPGHKAVIKHESEGRTGVQNPRRRKK